VRHLGKQGCGLGIHGNVRIHAERGLATVLLPRRRGASGALSYRSCTVASRRMRCNAASQQAPGAG
jgi:hypothetical protein